MLSGTERLVMFKAVNFLSMLKKKKNNLIFRDEIAPIPQKSSPHTLKGATLQYMHSALADRTHHVVKHTLRTYNAASWVHGFGCCFR